MPRRDPWFCLPVVFAMGLDAALTLAMQPGAYWGDPSKLLEGNATWAALLRIGPAAFIGAFAVYGIVIAALLCWLQGTLQKTLGMFILLAHTYGGASWAHLATSDRAYWWVLMGVLLAETIAFSIYWQRTTRPHQGA